MNFKISETTQPLDDVKSPHQSHSLTQLKFIQSQIEKAGFYTSSQELAIQHISTVHEPLNELMAGWYYNSHLKFTFWLYYPTDMM